MGDIYIYVHITGCDCGLGSAVKDTSWLYVGYVIMSGINNLGCHYIRINRSTPSGGCGSKEHQREQLQQRQVITIIDCYSCRTIMYCYEYISLLSELC